MKSPTSNPCSCCNPWLTRMWQKPKVTTSNSSSCCNPLLTSIYWKPKATTSWSIYFYTTALVPHKSERLGAEPVARAPPKLGGRGVWTTAQKLNKPNGKENEPLFFYPQQESPKARAVVAIPLFFLTPHSPIALPAALSIVLTPSNSITPLTPKRTSFNS